MKPNGMKSHGEFILKKKIIKKLFDDGVPSQQSISFVQDVELVRGCSCYMFSNQKSIARLSISQLNNTPLKMRIATAQSDYLLV